MNEKIIKNFQIFLIHILDNAMTSYTVHGRATITCSCSETALKYYPYIRTEFCEKTFLTFKKCVKNIQTVGYSTIYNIYDIHSGIS